jgi:toxin YoeB
MFKISFDLKGWEEYCYWKTQDKKTIKKIDTLLKELFKQPMEGIGKPEMLKGDLSGLWSRRIDEKNRLVYKIDKDCVEVLSCLGHYGDH